MCKTWPWRAKLRPVNRPGSQQWLFANTSLFSCPWCSFRHAAFSIGSFYMFMCVSFLSWRSILNLHREWEMYEHNSQVSLLQGDLDFWQTDDVFWNDLIFIPSNLILGKTLHHHHGQTKPAGFMDFFPNNTAWWAVITTHQFYCCQLGVSWHHHRSYK